MVHLARKIHYPTKSISKALQKHEVYYFLTHARSRLIHTDLPIIKFLQYLDWVSGRVVPAAYRSRNSKDPTCASQPHTGQRAKSHDTPVYTLWVFQYWRIWTFHCVLLWQAKMAGRASCPSWDYCQLNLNPSILRLINWKLVFFWPIDWKILIPSCGTSSSNLQDILSCVAIIFWMSK